MHAMHIAFASVASLPVSCGCNLCMQHRPRRPSPTVGIAVFAHLQLHPTLAPSHLARAHVRCTFIQAFCCLSDARRHTVRCRHGQIRLKHSTKGEGGRGGEETNFYLPNPNSAFIFPFIPRQTLHSKCFRAVTIYEGGWLTCCWPKHSRLLSGTWRVHLNGVAPPPTLHHPGPGFLILARHSRNV